MGPLSKRLVKIEKHLSGDKEHVIMVKIFDGEKVMQCNLRREDCPAFPCDTLNCWFKKRYPDAKKIHVDGECDYD